MICHVEVKFFHSFHFFADLYQRLNKRVEFGYMTKEEFQTWAAEAKLRRTQCQEGKITFDEYKNWLDETSLQKSRDSV